MTPEIIAAFVGKIAAFFPAKGSVVKCQRKAGTVRYHGQVIAAVKAPPVGPTKIPDATLTIRGKTGKTATVSLVENYVTIHDTWKAAALDT